MPTAAVRPVRSLTQQGACGSRPDLSGGQSLKFAVYFPALPNFTERHQLGLQGRRGRARG